MCLPSRDFKRDRLYEVGVHAGVYTDGLYAHVPECHFAESPKMQKSPLLFHHVIVKRIPTSWKVGGEGDHLRNCQIFLNMPRTNFKIPVLKRSFQTRFWALLF